MFYIEHGDRLEDGKVFDAKQYHYASDSDELSLQKMTIIDHEWYMNNCHPNGYFKCNRCYRKHFVIENFDLLCDGCVQILKNDYPEHDATRQLNSFVLTDELFNQRLTLRNKLDSIFKSDQLFHAGHPIEVVKNPVKNNGDLSVKYTDKENEKPFMLNVNDITQ